MLSIIGKRGGFCKGYPDNFVNFLTWRPDPLRKFSKCARFSLAFAGIFRYDSRMRMRKKKNLAARMERCETYRIKDPTACAGRWRGLLPGCRELRVELGCGKGRFTAESAKAEPDVMFIAIERVPDAMVVAMERAAGEGLNNVRFVDADVRNLPEFFSPGEADRIYINFCDPWPKSGQAKRRLTHGNFLRLYRQVLAPRGQIWFKSDNEKLFAFSLEEFPRFGFSLSEVTDNLHADGPKGVMTDYEAKFYAQGIPIHRLVATAEPWEEETQQKENGQEKEK